GSYQMRPRNRSRLFRGGSTSNTEPTEPTEKTPVTTSNAETAEFAETILPPARRASLVAKPRRVTPRASDTAASRRHADADRTGNTSNPDAGACVSGPVSVCV